ncbi:MAG: S41 family peptidase [Planctomycetaceae bacterium]
MNISSKLMMMMAVLTTATTTFGQDPYDSYRDSSYEARPARLSRSSSEDFPVLPERLSDYSRVGSTSSRVPLERTMPSDPFRVRRPVVAPDRALDGRDDFAREDADLGSAFPVRSNRQDSRLSGRGSVGTGSRSSRDYGFNEPVDDAPYRRQSPRYDLDRLDPFVPAPLPRGQEDEETSKIDELLTIRYSNPVNVRAIRAMSSQQAVQLFAEVSQKIDERSLEPTSYDVRVRRALRNLQMALDNPAFMNGLQISADSFQTDGFRDVLGRLADGQQVRNYQEARTVLNQVMQASQSVRGLTPSVVAFEFANASIDTLDKFSGLEAADPTTRNGAELQGQKTAALEEEIVGVGVEVKEHAEGLLVLKALRGGPAAEAGIQSGDVIISIDGRTLSGMKMLNSVDLMKGTSGSQMTVRIYREGKGERNFNLTRRKVRVWTVNDTRILEGTNVGYFSLSRFAQGSTAEVDQALSDLYSKGMKSLIIDLRGNPGGLLTTCVEVSDRFLACGTIVTTRGRLNGDNMVETAKFDRTWAVPLVVLVDGDSASASEIFAAAIQENGRGVIMGTKSYGKGSVQTHFPLNSITGDLRLTTALFYSPNGRKMAGEGVTPDIEILDRDGVANGDEVLIDAVRVAQSTQLKNMAQASAKCRPATQSGPRSSSLDNIRDKHADEAVVR